MQRRIVSSIRDDFGRYCDARGAEKVNDTLKLRAEACLDSLSGNRFARSESICYGQGDFCVMGLLVPRGRLVAEGPTFAASDALSVPEAYRRLFCPAQAEPKS